MGRLSKPLVPDGPIGVFYDRLHELHVAAGRPSTREMQRLTRGAGRPNGFNPTTVHETFASPRLSRWEVVREIVRHLGGDVGEFGELWRRAYEEQQRDPVREVPARAGEATAAADVPSQLPPDVPGFTGRGDHLKRLDELLPSGAAQGTVGVVAIAGMPGVGKTSLALHFAHQVRQRFPDGQIFVNLRGHSADGPTGTMGAVAHLLQAMGVQGHRIPVETGMAVGLYRSVLADKRVLVVLDDAATAEQVRPLLPAGASCLVLVTSRRLLTGLVVRDGAVQLELDVLDLAEARALLATILGADRIAAEPEAVSDLARACSFLPLALRVAAANLAVRPEISVAEYASALAGGGRLEALEVDGDEPSGVRAAFDLSYHALGAEEQRLFRCFGLVPVTELTVDAAAAMTATTASVARQRLERLATAHLIGRRAVDRYACHELLREYAAERGTDGMTSLRRLFDYYLFTADAAATSLYSEKLRLPLPAPAVPVRSFADKATALSWLDAERPDLMDVIRYCAANGPREIAWMLADTLRGYFRLRRSNPDWAEAARAALTAAEAEGNQRAQAAALLSLGDTGDAGSQRRQAIEHFTRALALCEQDGWEQGRSAALGKLGVAHRESGNLVAAAEFLNRGLALSRETGNDYTEAVLLGCLGRVHLQQGRLDAAVNAYTQALSRFSTLGARQGQAAAHDALGEALHAKGIFGQARGHLLQALAIEREVGDRGTEVLTLRNLATLHRDAGELDRAAGYADSMHALAGELGDLRVQADALRTLAAVDHGRGSLERAVERYTAALEASRATGYPYPEIETMIGLAEAHESLGDKGRAKEEAAQAHGMASAIGYAMLADRAAAVLERLGSDPRE